MGVRQDCRHYSTRTVAGGAAGEQVQRCRVDANEKAPSPARNIASSSSLARSPTLAGVGSTKTDPVRTTAKVDYAMRAAIELARGLPRRWRPSGPITRQAIADAQDIPAKFLEHILSDLKAQSAGSQRS